MNLIIGMNVCAMILKLKLKHLSKNKSMKKKRFTITTKEYMKKTLRFKSFKK